MKGWNHVRDIPPPQKGHYLVVDRMNNPKHNVHIAYWSEERQRWMACTNNASDDAANKNITHWMPIPKAQEAHA